jgi:hypothetical protein
MSSELSLVAQLRWACVCSAAKDDDGDPIACKKYSIPRITAFACQFLVTTKRSLPCATRSKICPNYVQAKNAGTYFVFG